MGSGGCGGLSRLSLECKEWGEGLAEVFGRRMEQGVLTGIGGDAVSYPPPDFWVLALTSPSTPEGPWMMCIWAALSTCPPSPRRAAAASPLNTREPEPEPEPRLALRLPQHPGPPQSPHVTSGCPITVVPENIKGAGLRQATPPGCSGGSRSASEGGIGSCGEG